MPIEQPRPSASGWVNPAVQVRSRETLERILDATQHLLDRRPFREITIAEIAKNANTSPPSIYARFENKQALLGALFERHAVAQRALIERLFELDRWQSVPLAATLRQTLPVMVAAYRAKQGLIRAFLEHASEDARFREAWSEVGDLIVKRVTQLVMARSFEIDHPHPERGIRIGLEVAFATLAHRIQMHEIDQPAMDERAEEMIRMHLRYLGIVDVPTAPDVNSNEN